MPPKATKKVNMTEESDDDSIKITNKALSKSKAVPVESDRYKLAQAINNIASKGDQFAQALTFLNTTTKDTLMDLDMQIHSKKSEMEDLQTAAEAAYKAKCLQLENDFNNSKLDTMQKIREFQLEACEEFASSHEQMLIKKEEHTKMSETIETLTEKVTSLEEKMAEEIESAIKKEKQLHHIQLKQELNTMELNHKAITAELVAQTNQQKREVEMLNNTIENLKHEIAEQRNLTKEIAKASSKSQITQSFGEK
jgi:hypothetical protein